MHLQLYYYQHRQIGEFRKSNSTLYSTILVCEILIFHNLKIYFNSTNQGLYIAETINMESSKKTSSMWCFIEDIHPTKMKLNKAIKLRLMRIFGYATPANKKEIVSLECLFHDSKVSKPNIQ